MDTTVGKYEEKNKKKGMLISILLHILLVLLIILPILTYPDPPPGQEGILVNLGLPDVGQGSDNAAPAETVESEVPEKADSEPEAAEPAPAEPTPEKVVTPEPQVEKEVIKTEDPEAIALKKRLEEKKREQEELERKRREAELQRQREEEARKKAEAEARRKAEEERKRKEAELKNKIGGLFGDGEGKGETGKPGNQGDPGGDPNSKILEGVSTGSGVVGGGLGNRGVAGRPKVSNPTQRTGRVVIEVCVDSNGNVISANYTQRGSTTTDSQLQSVAIENAKKWRFTESSISKQCGTITYDFKVK